MKSLSNKERKSSFVLVTMLFLLAFVGFVDAFYLSAMEYRGIVVTCGAGGCAEVTTSEYSKILGVPVAYLGLGHYAVMLTLAFFVFALKRRSLLRFPILPLSIVGIVASSWFVFAQLVLIGDICYFCMLSAVSSLLLFIVAATLVWRNKAHIRPTSLATQGETEEDSA